MTTLELRNLNSTFKLLRGLSVGGKKFKAEKGVMFFVHRKEGTKVQN